MKWHWIGSMVMAAALAAGCGGGDAPPVSLDAEAPGNTPAVQETAASQAPESGTASSEPAAESPAPAAGGPAKVDPKSYTTTSSGLKYAVLKPGTGETAEHHTVAVHYTGWLKDGKKFDSSLDRGEPIEFGLGHGQVIPGWDEGIKGMKVGEKRQLVIPAELGYGDRGTPDGSIPPGSTLIFDVELVRVSEGHQH